jgi:hypothetical protein
MFCCLEDHEDPRREGAVSDDDTSRESIRVLLFALVSLAGLDDPRKFPTALRVYIHPDVFINLLAIRFSIGDLTADAFRRSF